MILSSFPMTWRNATSHSELRNLIDQSFEINPIGLGKRATLELSMIVINGNTKWVRMSSID